MTRRHWATVTALWITLAAQKARADLSCPLQAEPACTDLAEKAFEAQASPCLSPIPPAPCLVSSPSRIVSCRSANDCAAIAETAESYLRALVMHDGSKVKLHKDVVRTENGIITAMGATTLRNDLTCGNQYQVISGIRDERFYIVGQDVFVMYLLDTTSTDPTGMAALQTSTAHIAERFHVVPQTANSFVIDEIEAVFWFNPGTAPESSCW
jgi:hypothetical protein